MQARGHTRVCLIVYVILSLFLLSFFIMYLFIYLFVNYIFAAFAYSFVSIRRTYSKRKFQKQIQFLRDG